MKNGMIVDKKGNKRWYKNRRLHREDGPAIEWADGSKSWFINGERHRIDGPAIEWADGSKLWFINGQLHRVDGPAMEWANGSKLWYIKSQPHRVDGPAVELTHGAKEWCINGRRHREDGPAIEKTDGTKEWYINGRRHREDGPAIEKTDGTKEWYLNHVEVTEQIVMMPETLTLAQIQKSRNNEVRSIMIERYGWQRYLVDSQAEMLDKRDNAIENTKEALFATRSFGNRLVVTCPTGRVFTLGVPSDAKTCEEAQQWLGNASAEINVIGRT
jgi:hypothetical protein